MALLVLASTLSKLNGLLNDTDNSTWTNEEKTNFITAGVRFLSNGERPKLWTEAEDDTVTTEASVDTYDLPDGFFQISQIWLEDSINSDPQTFHLIRRWSQWGTQFRFAHGSVPFDTGRIFRIKGVKKFTTITEVNDEYEDIVLDYAMYRAFTDLSNHTTLLNTYVAKLQGISRSEIQIRAREHKANAIDALRAAAKPLPPHYGTRGEI